MILVVKFGDVKPKRVKCETCSALLQYMETDVCSEFVRDKSVITDFELRYMSDMAIQRKFQVKHTRKDYIICPLCADKIYVEVGDDGDAPI